jgi:hypothetical protein
MAELARIGFETRLPPYSDLKRFECLLNHGSIVEALSSSTMTVWVGAGGGVGDTDLIGVSAPKTSFLNTPDCTYHIPTATPSVRTCDRRTGPHPLSL